MAPRDRRNSDPKVTLLRCAADDILQGIFDAADQGAVGTAAAAAAAAAAATATAAAFHGLQGDVGESKEMKRKIRQQLEQCESETTGLGQPKNDTVEGLRTNVDRFLRSKGELDDTESIVDPMEVEFKTPDNKTMKATVPRTGRVAELKSAVGQRSGSQGGDLLLGNTALTDDSQSVYKLWSHQRLGRRGGASSCLQMVPRCSGG